MMRAGICPQGGPKRPTEEQLAKANQLVAEDRYVYLENVQGASVVGAFRRYLETGESLKITRPLYDFLTLKCNYIAHFDLVGFRHVYDDPADLIAGSADGYSLLSSWQAPVAHSQSVYKDGMTSLDVYAAICALARQHGGLVEARKRFATRERELATARELASRHGFELVAS